VNVAGKNVLLTGATGGIGAAIAKSMAAKGAQLVLSGRRVEVLEPLAAETGARVVQADLAVHAELEALLEQAGEVDALIANAALPGSGRLEMLSVEEIDRALDVNLRAPVLLTRALAPGMATRGGGHIVFISSLAGKSASPGASIYNATKFALRGFSLSMRAELRPSGVGVSAIFPGFISDAGMFADTGIKLPPGIGTRTPDHVAAAVLRAITRNRAEIDVAPPSLRVGAAIAGLAPELAARVSRVTGGDKLALEFEDAQLDKRG
jgi:short-subunit dehydrogenase